MDRDEGFMFRCLELARKGVGFVSPNPLVGALLVYKNRIIGEGWHQRYGEAHAEVNCLQSVSYSDRPLIALSRLYVSLEPCSHFGKTPPCCDLIIREKIPEVVIGCVDPNEEVAGRGITRLQESGVAVTTGVLEQACRNLNKRFFTAQTRKRPYIILKWAETADGFMGSDDGKPVRISGWAEQRMVHKMRFEEDAVLVGYRTALNDNSRLNNRYWKPGKQPLRILIDFENSLPGQFYLKDGSQATLIFNKKVTQHKGATEWVKIAGKKPLVEEILENLPPINSLIIEGGQKTLQHFIDTGFWDEAHIWRNMKMFLKQGLAAPKLQESTALDSFAFGDDDVLFLYEHNQ